MRNLHVMRARADRCGCCVRRTRSRRPGRTAISGGEGLTVTNGRMHCRRVPLECQGCPIPTRVHSDHAHSASELYPPLPPASPQPVPACRRPERPHPPPGRRHRRRRSRPQFGRSQSHSGGLAQPARRRRGRPLRTTKRWRVRGFACMRGRYRLRSGRSRTEMRKWRAVRREARREMAAAQ